MRRYKARMMEKLIPVKSELNPRGRFQHFVLKSNRFSDDYTVNALELLMNAFAYPRRYSRKGLWKGEGRGVGCLVGSRRGTKWDQPRKRDRSEERSLCSIPGIIFSERVGINERIKMRIPASSIRVCLWIKRVERASDLVRARESRRKGGRKKRHVVGRSVGSEREENAQRLAGIGYKSWPTRWRHRSILCMPDESTRLGSDTELAPRPTREYDPLTFKSRYRIGTLRFPPSVSLFGYILGYTSVSFHTCTRVEMRLRRR